MSRKSKAAEFVQEGYNISITGRHLMVTDAMKQYALEKLTKIEKFDIRIIDVAVVMDIQKLEHRVEIIMKLDHILIKSQGLTEDMYASIDRAVDKLQTQLRKYRKRITDHQAKKVTITDMNVNVMRGLEEQELDEDLINGAIDEENEKSLMKQYSPHGIVANETIPLKILTYDEAIMKMELSNDAFMVFRNEEDMKLKVIYRRPNGNFGIIEPES